MVVQEILTQVKSDISSGRLSRNGKLPVREDLGKYYGVSKSTVQKVFAALEKEGFIISKGSQGTFVNPRSPDRTDVAVILPAGSREQIPNSLYSQFGHERAALEQATGKRFRLFYVDDMRKVKDDFLHLAQEVRALKFWGAIFLFAPQDWMYEPFLENDIPVVSLTDELCRNISTVWVDYSDLLEKMLEECKASGCRRPALISMTSVPYRHIIDYKNKAAELGIEVSDRMICGLQALSKHPEWFRHPVYSLFSGDSRPDSLLLLDETFLFHTCAALLELGLLPGRDIRIISQRTFPGSLPAPQPVTFIGFRMEEIVNSCLRALTALSEGQAPVDKFELIQAVKQ